MAATVERKTAYCWLALAIVPAFVTVRPVYDTDNPAFRCALAVIVVGSSAAMAKLTTVE